jgi:hypothetical protein
MSSTWRRKILDFIIPPANEVWGVYWNNLVRLSVDAICPEFISNTTIQISFKLYAYLSYII